MSKSFNILKKTLISSITFLLILYVIIGFYYCKLPDKFYLASEESFKLNDFIEIKSAKQDGGTISVSSTVTERQNNTMSLNLFGLIPVKNIEVEHIERPQLVPGGMPFGIKMLTGGAVVTGFGNVDGINLSCSPAKENGIKSGDIIRKINDIAISKNSDITKALQANKARAHVILERSGEIIGLKFKPEISKKDGLAKIGLWVRDSSAGIGTVTFYNPQNNSFGGLGHGVCDIDTGKLLPLHKGEAVSVSIGDVIKGLPGSPGELSGTFLSRVPIGTIKSNTELGVFGTANFTMSLENGIPMAFKQDVKVGKAAILSTVNGNSPKEFDIIIEKIDYNEKNKVKNMIIRIIDPLLLNTTGGIVQGMSGSPIIQNGMLCGAVTHVFVNDAKRGYGVFAEHMFKQSRMIETEDAILAA
ncbi:MAG: SpoIVB peptidase [Eubacterium sp.]|jgi:stage IV sporulation protein B|nr:SpoIVB peptidase [Eubacterium sp.]